MISGNEFLISENTFLDIKNYVLLSISRNRILDVKKKVKRRPIDAGLILSNTGRMSAIQNPLSCDATHIKEWKYWVMLPRNNVLPLILNQFVLY